MKKTLFITMLAAALTGSQVFAEEFIPTSTDATLVWGIMYAGAYSDTDDVTGANVTINEDWGHGDDYSAKQIYGGRTNGSDKTATNNSVTILGGQVYYVESGFSMYGDATNNTATVSGGQITQLYGGSCSMEGSASTNTVTVSGGQLGAVYGGRSGAENADGNTVYVLGGQVADVYGGCGNGTANGNTVVLAGCTVETYVTAGWGDEGGACDNRVYLLGEGASVKIGGREYTGGELTVGRGVYVGWSEYDVPCTGNSIEIYGTEITAATLSSMQMVNFHIADGVLLSQEAMVSLTSTSDGEGLDLTGVELGFNAADVQDWGAYEGQSITLVTAAQSITIDAGSLGDVEIKDANGTTVATATLALGGSDDVLSLSNIKGATPVPEPATGTLGLFALVGLCMRKRRK